MRGKGHVAIDTAVPPDPAGLGDGGRQAGRAQLPRPHNGHSRQH